MENLIENALGETMDLCCEKDLEIESAHYAVGKRCVDPVLSEFEFLKYVVCVTS